ncbi:MAG: SDR family oxidoreductase [Cyclobacteriaceae bacterium]
MSEVKINVKGKVVLISGANRGIGRALVVEALNRGAEKVYAGARNVETLSSLAQEFGDQLVPVHLDVTDENSVKNVAKAAGDVEILINNAGVLAGGGFAVPGALESLQNHLDVNVFGLVRLTSAFVDIIKAKDSGAIVNVSSAAGLANMPSIGTYSSTKAMVHSITQGLRGELANENVLVAGVYPGPIDTDMAKGFEMDKDSPENVAKNTYDALDSGVEDIFPDTMSAQVGAGYAQNPKAIEKEFGAYVG